MFTIIKQNKNFLIFLFLFCFILRGIFFVSFLSKDKNYFTADSSPYNQLAIQIALGNGIINSDNTSHFFRLPGYPALLAIGYKLFNFDVIKTLWCQIIFSSFIPLLVFFLSLVLFPANILLAKICSLYSVFHLGFIIFSGLLMSETFFVLFFLSFLILFFYKFYFLSGFLLGMASICRPVGHYVLFLSFIIIFFSGIGFYSKFKKSFFFFMGWIFIVFGLLLRNFLFTGFLFFHTLPGKHFLNHSAAYIVMKVDKISYKKAKDKLLVEMKYDKNLSEIEKCLKAEKLAFKYIKQYPFLFVKHGIINILKTTFAPFSQELSFMDEKKVQINIVEDENIFKKIKKILLPKILDKRFIYFLYLELLFLILVYAGFIGFIINSFYNKKILFLILKVFPFILLFVFITLAAGFARLRLPIEPLIFIPAFHFWLKRLRQLDG